MLTADRIRSIVDSEAPGAGLTVTLEGDPARAVTVSTVREGHEHAYTVEVRPDDGVTAQLIRMAAGKVVAPPPPRAA